MASKLISDHNQIYIKLNQKRVMMKLINYNFNIRELARIISDVRGYAILSIPIFIIFNYFTTCGNKFLELTFLCLIFVTFLPFTAILMWIKYKNLDLDFSNKDERIFPLLIGIMSSFMGVIVLSIANAPAVIIVLMFCYLTTTLLTLFITYFWKISVHAIGVAGLTAAISYVFGYLGLLFGPPLLLVMWSRIYLQKHTPAQVVAGAATSLIFTWTQFTILLS